MLIQRRIIITNPKLGFFSPKKTIDQSTFRTSWAQNQFKLIFLPQTRYKEIPINMYRIVQTGPKTQEGGLKKGFTRVGYQVVTEFTVKIDPISPAPSQSRIESKSFGNFPIHP